MRIRFTKDLKETHIQLIYATDWIEKVLGEEEFQKLRERYFDYTESERFNGNTITPFYIWVLKQIEIKIKE